MSSQAVDQEVPKSEHGDEMKEETIECNETDGIESAPETGEKGSDDIEKAGQKDKAVGGKDEQLKSAKADPRYTSKGAKAPHNLEMGQAHVDEPSGKDDDYLSQIQPLPLAQSPIASRGPGAHAVQGRPEFVRDRDTRPVPPTPQVEEVFISENVIHEAVVCEDEEEETRPDASSSLSEDPELGRQESSNFEEVIDAKIVPEEPHRPKHSLWGWFIILLLLLAGLAIFVPIFLKRTRSQNPDHNIGHHSSTRQDPLPPFLDELPMSMRNFIADPTHPHHFANTWMWNDPYRESYSRQRQLQRFHLASFYFTTGGDHWFRNDDWLSYDVSECEWFSQHHNESIPHYEDYPICDEQGNFQILNLASNNLQGRFPLVNNFIDTLRTYDISNNNISGALPIAPAPLLEVFIVSNNNFEGPLITGGNLEGQVPAFNLRVIKLDGNNLYGTADIFFLLLNKLEVVEIAGNHFGGAVPKSASFSPNLMYFGIAHNDFEGTIPSELSRLQYLQTIDVSGNALITGSIPSELSRMPELGRLDVSGTSVSGTVPASFCSAVEIGAIEFFADCGASLSCCGQ